MAEKPSSTQLDKWAPDATRSRHDFFALGQQPNATRDAGKGEKIGVVGAGDVWKKFIMPALAQRGLQASTFQKEIEPTRHAHNRSRGTGCFF